MRSTPYETNSAQIVSNVSTGRVNHQTSRFRRQNVIGRALGASSSSAGFSTSHNRAHYHSITNYSPRRALWYARVWSALALLPLFSGFKWDGARLPKKRGSELVAMWQRYSEHYTDVITGSYWNRYCIRFGIQYFENYKIENYFCQNQIIILIK